MLAPLAWVGALGVARGRGRLAGRPGRAAASAARSGAAARVHARAVRPLRQCGAGRRRLPGSVERDIRGHELIPPGGDVVCLVSGGADSTCLWHVLGELGYRVSALHVDHGLRGRESDEDARFCREQLGAEVVDGRRRHAPRRSCGGSATRSRPIACARPATRRPTRSRPSSTGSSTSGAAGRDQAPPRGRRRAAAARPLARRRPRRTARAVGIAFRLDSSNAEHQARATSAASCSRGCATSTRAPTRTCCGSLERRTISPGARRAARLGGRRRSGSTWAAARVAVREYDSVWLEARAGAAGGRGALGALDDPVDGDRP